MPITVGPARGLSRSTWIAERRKAGLCIAPRALAITLGPASIASRFPRPSVMGVVNVTPDSFSDGGVNFRAEDAVASARRMVEEGAAIVDVGGESTRPGSEGVSAEEELRRVEPVLEALQGEVPVSIDTAKAAVAQRAIELGAELVNDVTALRGDPELAGVVAVVRRLPLPDAHAGRAADDAGRPDLRGRGLRGRVLPRGAPGFRGRRGHPRGADLPRPGLRLRQDRGAELRAPGAGSARSPRSAGRSLVGLSRKRSLGRILGDPEATTGPLSASLAAAVEAYERGAAIFRVHDVREHVEALTVAAAVG